MSVQSTIDKIADTTIMRMMRKMAGVIDDQNAVVENVQEQLDSFNLDEVKARLDTDESSISTNTTDIASLKVDVAANTTQIDTNKKNIESLRDANLIITKDITEIKEKNTEQDTEITNLDNADIATATSEFDNTARKLTITLNPKSGDAITTETIIPASGETGDDYTATAPIAIANKDISLAIDTDTMEITDDGKLKSKADGKTYVAGSGISIDDTTNAISVDETVIATKATTDNLDTQIKECATGVANAITQAQTANTNALDAYNAVALSDTHLVLTKGNGNSDEIVLPSSGEGEWVDLDLTNLPTDFKEGDIIEISTNLYVSATASSWATQPSISNVDKSSTFYQSVIIPMSSHTFYVGTPVVLSLTESYLITAMQILYEGISGWNNPNASIFTIIAAAFNGKAIVFKDITINHTNISTYITKIRRKKSSS